MGKKIKIFSLSFSGKKRNNCSPLLLWCHCSDLPQWQGQPQWCLEARQGGILIAIITIHNDIHRSITMTFLDFYWSSGPRCPLCDHLWKIFQLSLSIWSLIIRSASPSMRPSTAPVLPEEWVLNLFIFIQGEKVVRRKVSIINTPFIFFDDFWFLIKTFPAAKGNTCGGKDASSLTSCMQSFVVYEFH